MSTMTTDFPSIQKHDERVQLCDALNEWLADLIALSLDLKQAHWNVSGPGFKAIHEQLDEILADVRSASDDVAERVVTIGGAAEGRATAVARARPTQGVEDGLLKVRSVVEQICAQLERATRNGRACLRKLAADPVSEDLAIGILAKLEKHHWMLRSQHDQT